MANAVILPDEEPCRTEHRLEVRRLSVTRALILSMLLGRTMCLFPYQLNTSVPPDSPLPASSEADCNEARAKARSLAENLDSSRAAVLLADVFAKCPTYENGRDLADAEIVVGQYASAKALLETMMEQQNRAELHSLLGKAEAAQKNYKAAAIEYQKAAEMEPTETNIFDFGMSLFRLDHNSAITILRYGVQKYPQSVKLHVALGTVLYADGKSVEGAELLCDAEDLNPSDPHPMEILADTEIVPPALAPRVTSLFAELHRKYETDGLILFDYTMVESGRWSNDRDAEPLHFADSLRAALRLNPRLPQVYYQLSLISAQQRNYQEEVQFLKKAISMDPGKDEYHYRLAFAYKKSGDEAKFREELSEFEKLHNATSDGQ
jgi:Tfp pilus assembly protein PilF